MRVILKFLAALCLATLAYLSTGEAAPPPPSDPPPPPYCEGSELEFTVRDGLTEFLTAWCAWRDPSEWPAGFCIPYTLGNWCPTWHSCSAIMCGVDLNVYHPACVVAVTQTGVSPQWCLDFYSRLRIP